MVGSNHQKFGLRNGVGIDSGLIKNAIKQTGMMACEILKQYVPHIALAVAMTKKENRIGVLNSLN